MYFFRAQGCASGAADDSRALAHGRRVLAVERDVVDANLQAKEEQLAVNYETLRNTRALDFMLQCDNRERQHNGQIKITRDSVHANG
jgi:hypothetical protein